MPLRGRVVSGLGLDRHGWAERHRAAGAAVVHQTFQPLLGEPLPPPVDDPRTGVQPLSGVVEAMADLFDVPMGKGTLAGLLPEAAGELKGFSPRRHRCAHPGALWRDPGTGLRLSACRPTTKRKHTGGWTNAEQEAWNLGTRTRRRADQMLRLLEDTRVPADNNTAERSFRFVKLHDLWKAADYPRVRTRCACLTWSETMSSLCEPT
jgi:hypothetical protein